MPRMLPSWWYKFLSAALGRHTVVTAYLSSPHQYLRLISGDIFPRTAWSAAAPPAVPSPLVPGKYLHCCSSMCEAHPSPRLLALPHHRRTTCPRTPAEANVIHEGNLRVPRVAFSAMSSAGGRNQVHLQWNSFHMIEFPVISGDGIGFRDCVADINFIQLSLSRILWTFKCSSRRCKAFQVRRNDRVLLHMCCALTLPQKTQNTSWNDYYIWRKLMLPNDA